MKQLTYIGNYAQWIKQEWIDYLLNNDGDFLPRKPGEGCEDWYGDEPPWKGEDSEHGLETWEYKVVSQSYKYDILPWAPETIPFDVGYDYDGWEWFFLKILPSQGQPVHKDYPIDPDAPGSKGIHVDRFWMPLQDYKQGHIFWYEDQIISDYKMGDVFKYDHPQDWHSGANMGHSTRLTCNITTWKYQY